jgi:ribonuclease G
LRLNLKKGVHMSKELYIASSPHETKVAVLDDDQLVEIYFERDTDVGLVGGIYKGRVNRVLPGMQSAFVDIGLERDAFLYVSDFFEDAEEYDKIVAEAEARITRFSEKTSGPQETPRAENPEPPAAAAPEEPHAPENVPVATAPAEAPVASSSPRENVAPPAEAAVTPAPAPSAPHAPDRPSGERPRDFRDHEHRGHRRRRRGRRFEGNKFSKPEFRERPPMSAPPREPSVPQSFEILPGESLAKYRHGATEASVHETATSEPAEGLTGVHTEDSHAESSFASESAPADSSATGQLEPKTVEPPAAPMEAAPAESAPAPVALPSETQVPAPRPTEPEEKPRPLWNRLVSTVFGETARAPEEKTEPAPAVEAQAPMAEPSREELPVQTPMAESTAEAISSPTAETASPAADESGSPWLDEPAELTETGSEAAPGDEPTAQETPGEHVERAYTLREPSQRPRFAPRRRRGRRGRGQPRDIRPGGHAPRQEPRPGNNQPVQISELLKEGQEILVQIAKEPLGRKGARITSHIALPGRYLVYMPTVDHIGVSRKIASEEERLRLRNIILENKGPVPGGFIVRTAGAGKPDDELKADMQFLSSLWSDIRRKAESSKAPALLHADLNLVQRILRDILSPDFKTVWLDSEIEYERTLEFVSRCQPSIVGHVKLYTKTTPMFEEFGIQAEIEKALKPKVWLKSGGYIVINQTEALVAIDVNTGKYVGKTNRLEDTIVKTNIDAVNEIVRQIRMRDLGGILVIDFIDMDERRNRNKVVQALEEALRKDRAPTKILSFNDFGLVAITRKRVKQSLERTLCEPCAYCSGAGWIKSVSTVCHEILAEAKKMASELEGDVVTLRVNPEVARALKSREGLVLGELESLLHKNVIVKSDEAVHQERFEIYGG